MNLTLRIWRQQSASAPGSFVSYRINDVTPEMSFLEMLDMLNEDLINRHEPPVAFEHDCREGICGSCGFLVNGVAMAASAAQRSVSWQCASSTTATRLRSSRGAPGPSPSFAI
jgi:succinate dehydrogenase/fumarate reductase-like Fe-S protein